MKPVRRPETLCGQQGVVALRPVPGEGIPEPIPGAARRAHLRKNDLKRVGLTPGCPGCGATAAGLRSRGHTEECRVRV